MNILYFLRVTDLDLDLLRCFVTVCRAAERARKKTSPVKKKTPSGKLGTKSEILAALDEMEFSGPALVSAAQGLADALTGRKKVTLRTFHVSAQPELQSKDIAAIRDKLNVSQAVCCVSWHQARKRHELGIWNSPPFRSRQKAAIHRQKESKSLGGNLS
jgi:hypothetical protein